MKITFEKAPSMEFEEVPGMKIALEIEFDEHQKPRIKITNLHKTVVIFPKDIPVTLPEGFRGDHE